MQKLCPNCKLRCLTSLQKIYKIHEYERFFGDENIIQEIYQRDPIACGIAVLEALESYTGGIFCDETGDISVFHGISNVSFGDRTANLSGL